MLLEKYIKHEQNNNINFYLVDHDEQCYRQCPGCWSPPQHWCCRRESGDKLRGSWLLHVAQQGDQICGVAGTPHRVAEVKIWPIKMPSAAVVVYLVKSLQLARDLHFVTSIAALLQLFCHSF